MKSRAEIVSFGLFIVVALAGLFYVLAQRHPNLALGGALAAVIAIRGGMFLYNLKRQRDRVEGRKPEPEIKLDL